MKQPRYYQTEAVESIINGWKAGQVPYANMAPGSGKSLVLAMLSERCLLKDKRVLQLVPKLEHVKQNREAMLEWSASPHKVGVCCAALSRKETHKDCIIATPGSFYRERAKQHIDMLLIDEVHNVPNDEKSVYRKIIAALRRINPKLVIAGVSGTPYREGQGMMHESCIKGNAVFTHQVYETPIAKMIEEGFLCHIESMNGDCEIDTSDLRTKGKDFDIDQMNVKFDAISEQAVEDIKAKFQVNNIQTAIIFTSSVANAYHVAELWGDGVKVLHGGISKHERENITNWLEKGEGSRVVINPNILTEGYDFPALEAVVLLRATKSLRLYVQMVTRAIRQADGKSVGYILDYGQNIDRHGPIDATNPPKNKKKKGDAPMRLCTECYTLNRLTAKKCENCEAVFIIDDKTGLYSMKTKAQILSDKLKSKEREYTIEYEPVFVKAWSRKDETEMIKMMLAGVPCEHYICLAHKGYARNMAEQFVLMLLKNQDDFFILKQNNALTIDNMLKILNNNYSTFFKRIEKVTVGVKNGRKHLVDMILTEVDNVSA